MPTFTIITVCYNSDKTISKTIESVLNQAFQNLEYLIIDGGSSDRTLDIIKKYELHFNERLKLVSEPDNGIYDAMNKGIKIAKGEWIIFLNSGDLFYDNNVLNQLYDFIKLNGLKDCYIFGDVETVDDCENVIESIRYPETINSKFIVENVFCHQTSVFHRKLFEIHGCYDLTYRIIADYVYTFLLYTKRVKFVHFNGYISKYLVGGYSAVNVNQQFIEKAVCHNKMLFHQNSIFIKASILWFKNKNMMRKVIRAYKNIIKKFNNEK